MRSEIVQRGEDFSVQQNVFSRPGPDGNPVFSTNRFTFLENGLNYFDGTEWKQSEDLIEVFPDGAVAQRGPNKAIFSSELNSVDVFDIESSDGKRLRGGVRAIRLTDDATGASVILSTVNEQAAGALVPPNQIVYVDGLTGAVEADVVLVWRHNYFCQDVVLKTRPVLPPQMAPETTRLEILTEFVDPPPPTVRQRVRSGENRPEVVDDSVIDFGSLAIVVGKAFPMREGGGFSIGNWDPMTPGTPILKRWQPLADGRTFLVESISWADLQPHLENLQVAKVRTEMKEVQMAGLAWPEKMKSARKAKPMEVAHAIYEPKGYVLDFVILPNNPLTTTFATEETYYIQNNYYSANAVTFERGSTLKFKDGKYMLLYGGVTFPDSLQPTVLTSRNDDEFGAKIMNVEQENDSDGDASKHKAAVQVWIYYYDASSTIRNARFRWAQTGIQYDQNGEVTAAHTLQNCLFEKIQGSGTEAIYMNMPAGTLNITDVQKIDVDNNFNDPYTFRGTVNGTINPAPFTTTQKIFVDKYLPANAENRLGVAADENIAVGTSHFVTIMNKAVAVYNKSDGTKAEDATTSTLFYNDTNHNDMSDPRIAYDPALQRWIAVMLNKSNDDLRIAVSTSSTPTSLNSWTPFHKSVAEAQWYADFPTLGFDGNGIYITVKMVKDGQEFNPNYWKYKLVAIKKPTSGEITESDIKGPDVFNNQTGYNNIWIYPAINYDAVTTGSPVWFIGKGAPGSSQGTLQYGKMTWNGSQLGTVDWNGSLTISKSYYDMDKNQTMTLPQKPTSPNTVTPNKLAGSRFHGATIRDGFLWTTHHIGLDGGGNDTYDGGTVDRMGIGWYKVKILNGSLSLSSQDGAIEGRIYDSRTTTTSAYRYSMPSLAVNSNGDVLIGFSMACSTEYIGSVYWGRKSNGSILNPLRLIEAGNDYWNLIRWGDYSGTCVDSTGNSFWTIQQNATMVRDDVNDYNCYSLWVAKISLL